MRCPKCGSETADGSLICAVCGERIEPADAIAANEEDVDGVLRDPQNGRRPQGEHRSDGSIPFYHQMWFIISIALIGSFLLPLLILAAVLFIARIRKYPAKRKSAWIGVGSCLACIAAIFCFVLFAEGADERKINRLLENERFNEAIEYVENHYSPDTYIYYYKIADIYERQNDYDSAALSLMHYTETVADLSEINNATIAKIGSYQGKISEENEKIVQERIDEISSAAAEKKEAELKAAQEAREQEAAEKAEKERAAQEVREQKAAEKAEKERAAQEAREQKAAEKAEKERAAQEAREQKAAEKAEKERAAQEAKEKQAEEERAAKEAAEREEERRIVEDSQVLGTDLVMEAHSSKYVGNYYKAEGIVEKIDKGSYLLRYLSTVDQHMRIYQVWILADDTSGRSVGEELAVVGKYVGFAENSTAPTLEQYRVSASTQSFYSALSERVKTINVDVSFEDLLRYGEYQEYVYFEGIVTNVYESCINVRDGYDNYYLVFDNRLDPDVILPDDIVTVYGQFEGIQKSGYVWPKISWLADGDF